VAPLNPATLLSIGVKRTAFVKGLEIDRSFESGDFAIMLHKISCIFGPNSTTAAEVEERMMAEEAEAAEVAEEEMYEPSAAGAPEATARSREYAGGSGGGEADALNAPPGASEESVAAAVTGLPVWGIVVVIVSGLIVVVAAAIICKRRRGALKYNRAMEDMDSEIQDKSTASLWKHGEKHTASTTHIDIGPSSRPSSPAGQTDTFDDLNTDADDRESSEGKRESSTGHIGDGEGWVETGGREV
jgi:hypothetical protein